MAQQIQKALKEVEPIEMRLDVIAIKSVISPPTTVDEWCKFVYVWAIREPALIEAYINSNCNMASIQDLKVKYEFIPKLAPKCFGKVPIARWRPNNGGSASG